MTTIIVKGIEAKILLNKNAVNKAVEKTRWIIANNEKEWQDKLFECSFAYAAYFGYEEACLEKNNPVILNPFDFLDWYNNLSTREDFKLATQITVMFVSVTTGEDNKDLSQLLNGLCNMLPSK